MLLRFADQVDEPFYVADPETFELLYCNEAFTREGWGEWRGKRCYNVLQQRDSPCPFCTNHKLFGPDAPSRVVWTFRNEVNLRTYKCIDMTIPWDDGRPVRAELAIAYDPSMESSTDATPRESTLQAVKELLLRSYTCQGSIELADAAIDIVLPVVTSEAMAVAEVTEHGDLRPLAVRVQDLPSIHGAREAATDAMTALLQEPTTRQRLQAGTLTEFPAILHLPASRHGPVRIQCVAFPLRRDRQLDGWLVLGSAPEQLSNQDQLLVTAFAASLSVALYNKRLETRLAHQRHELEREISRQTREIAEREELFRTILEQISDAVFLTTSDGGFVWVCPNAQHIFELDRHEIEQLETIHRLIGSDRQLLDLPANQKERANIPWVIERPDGEQRHLYINVKRVDMGGATRLVTCRDVTDTVASQQHFAMALEAVPQPIMVHRSDGAVVYINETWTRVTGYTHEDIPSLHHWITRAYGRRASAIEDVIERLHRITEPSHEGVFAITTKAGEHRHLDFSSAPLGRDPNGHLLIISIGVDQTDRIVQDQHVREHARALQRSNRDLEAFAYVTSHDLQEPVRMMGSFADLLQRRNRDNLDGKSQSYLAHITDGAKRLRTMIDALLTFARVHTRYVETEWIDLRDAWANALDNCSLMIDESGAAIETDPLPSVCFNRHRMIQVLQNLLSNAIKYRADRPLRIRLTAERCEEPKPGWSVSLHDNGTGIEHVNLKRIFAIFQRGLAREGVDGTGLGLSLVRRIVELRGGQVWVTSTPGQGSTFTFTIPDALPVAVTSPGEADADSQQPA